MSYRMMSESVMAEDCHDCRPKDLSQPHQQRHRQVMDRCRCCCCGRAEDEKSRPAVPASMPSWVATIYQLITTADFCKPGKQAHGRKGQHLKGIMLHNSATTCDMSDESSSSSMASLPHDNELFAPGRHHLPVDERDEEESAVWQSPPTRQRAVTISGAAAPSTTGTPLLPRPRLASHTSLTMSCRTTDSARHRRNNQEVLPTPEQIWCPSIVVVTQQLTIPSLSDHDDGSKSQSESLDLSDSDASACSDTLMEAVFAKVVEDDSIFAASPLRHVRNLSYCSSSSEQDTEVTCLVDDGAAEVRDDVDLDIPGQGSGLVTSPERDWTLDWLNGTNGDSLAFCGKTCPDIVPVAPSKDHSNEPAYLPIYPVPPAASAAPTAATIFSAGWCAVFYDLKPLRINEELVLDITTSNICFLQILCGGMLQLTSAVDGDRKTVLISPQSSSSKIKLLSKRIGYCLVLETTASTEFNALQTLFVLPISLPGSFREEMKDYFDEQRSMPPVMPSLDLFFSPSRDGLRQYAPNPQHEAAIHLSFAMDAAMKLDEATRRRRWS